MTRALLRTAVFAAIMVVLGCGPAAVPRFEEKPAAMHETKPAMTPEAKPFVTPEAVVEHFVKSVAVDDFDAAMLAFAIDDQAVHFDFTMQARRLGLFDPTFLDAPARYKMYVRTNTFAAMDRAAGQLVTFVTAFLIGPAEATRLGQGPRGANAAAKVIATLQGMDRNKLRGLKVVRVDVPHKPLMGRADVVQLLKEQGAVWGAEDLTERIALVQLGDEHYICGFRILKYDSSWRLQSLHSNFASERGYRHAMPDKITPEEFEAFTK